MAFGDEKAENLVAVGRIDARSARLWCRAARSGPLLLRIRGARSAFDRTVELVADGARDNTASATYPDDFPGEPDLLPITAYRCDLRSATGDLVVGEAAFETAPLGASDTPDSFGVGLISCHQPFLDGSGLVPDERLAVLRALPAWFSRHNVKFVMMMGDQVYSDEPGQFSLFNPAHARTVGPSGDVFAWPAEAVRQALQARYRTFWGPIPWRKLMTLCPTLPILDDHEVYDDFGSLPAAEEERRGRIAEGARLAYMDYQGARQTQWGGTLPAAHDYQFRYGTLAGFVFDLRSERSLARGRVVSDAQLARFEAFLAANEDAEALLLVTSVPFVHIPEWLARKGPQFAPNVDFADHWSAPPNLADRGRIVALLRRHLERPRAAGQKVVIAGGDVHVGGAFVLRLVGTGRPIFQLTSSAVSNPVSDPVKRWAGGLGPALFDTFSRTADDTFEVKLLAAGQGSPNANPFTGMNAGVVHFQRMAGRTNVRLRLLGATDGGVRDVFESAIL